MVSTGLLLWDVLRCTGSAGFGPRVPGRAYIRTGRTNPAGLPGWSTGAARPKHPRRSIISSPQRIRLRHRPFAALNSDECGLREQARAALQWFGELAAALSVREAACRNHLSDSSAVAALRRGGRLKPVPLAEDNIARDGG